MHISRGYCICGHFLDIRTPWDGVRRERWCVLSQNPNISKKRQPKGRVAECSAWQDHNQELLLSKVDPHVAHCSSQLPESEHHFVVHHLCESRTHRMDKGWNPPQAVTIRRKGALSCLLACLTFKGPPTYRNKGGHLFSWQFKTPLQSKRTETTHRPTQRAQGQKETTRSGPHNWAPKTNEPTALRIFRIAWTSSSARGAKVTCPRLVAWVTHKGRQKFDQGLGPTAPAASPAVLQLRNAKKSPMVVKGLPLAPIWPCRTCLMGPCPRIPPRSKGPEGLEGQGKAHPDQPL